MIREKFSYGEKRYWIEFSIAPSAEIDVYMITEEMTSRLGVVIRWSSDLGQDIARAFKEWKGQGAPTADV